MMISSGDSYSTDSLISSIEDKFGKETRYHSCSKSELTAAERVSFLQTRGKFIPANSGFTTDKSKICNH